MRTVLARIGAALVVLLLAPSGASAQSPPEGYVTAWPRHVHLESETAGVVLSIADGQGGWSTLGTAPCEVTLPPGRVDLGLGFHGHGPIAASITVDVPDGARLVAHYESRLLLRELGVGLVLGTIVGVLIGLAIGVGGLASGATDVGIGGLVAAGTVGVVGGATGGALATLEDVVSLDVL